MQAEIIYIGGGNALALFRDRTLVQRVGERLGIQVAVNCPGIQVAAAYVEMQPENFSKDLKELDKELEKTKKKLICQPLYSPFSVVEQDNQSHQAITRSFGIISK